MTRQIKQLTQGQIVGRVHSVRADPRARTYFLHFRPPPTHVPQQSQRQRLLSNNFLQATLAWTHTWQESLGSYMVLGTSGVYFPLSVGVLRRGYLHGHLDMLNNLAQQRYFPLLFSAPSSHDIFLYFLFLVWHVYFWGALAMEVVKMVEKSTCRDNPDCLQRCLYHRLCA